MPERRRDDRASWRTRGARAFWAQYGFALVIVVCIGLVLWLLS
jgi:hypothetical protein